MSRVKRSIAIRKLRNSLSIADDKEFMVMVWAVIALQSGRPDRAKLFLKFPAQAAVNDLTSEYSVHPWKAETLINELLTTSKAKARPGLNRHLICRNFDTIAELINSLNSIENADDGIVLKYLDIFQELHRLVQKQFEWQRGFLNHPQLYRSAYIYSGSLTKDHFIKSTGISLDDFSLICFALRAMYFEFPGVLRNIDLSVIDITPVQIESALRLLSLPIESARLKARELRATGGHISYKKSVLRIYPCIEFPENGGNLIAPIPDLVTLRGTSGIFYDVISGSDNVKNEISSRFESYCLHLLQALLPQLQVHRGDAYVFRKNRIDTPDILLSNAGLLVGIFECKATKMSYEARFSEDPLKGARRGYEEIAKGVFQIWRFASHIRRGVATGYNLSANARGIVLTLDTWLTMSESLQNSVIAMAKDLCRTKDAQISDDDQIPVVFCPVDELEHTLSATTEAEFLQVLEAATTGEFQGWTLGSVRRKLLPEERPSRNYPFSSRLAEILSWWDKFVKRTEQRMQSEAARSMLSQSVR